MSASKSWLRRQVPALAALVLVAAAFLIARPATSSAGTVAQMAKGYSFQPMSIALPGGYTQQTVREVNQRYKHIDWWISSVGAGVAMNDLDGDGLANDICLSDPRTDQVYVAPAPGKGENRYAAFALSAGSLPTTGTMAPIHTAGLFLKARSALVGPAGLPARVDARHAVDLGPDHDTPPGRAVCRCEGFDHLQIGAAVDLEPP